MHLKTKTLPAVVLKEKRKTAGSIQCRPLLFPRPPRALPQRAKEGGNKTEPGLRWAVELLTRCQKLHQASGAHEVRLALPGEADGGRYLELASVSPLTPAGGLEGDHNSEVTQGKRCPSCQQKGLVQALRTYRISFEESILLCENPQCIYPLGSQPLSNLLIPTDQKGCPSQDTCRKRKLSNTSQAADPNEQCLKLSRTADDVVNSKKILKYDLIPAHSRNHLLGVKSGQPVTEVQLPNCNNAVESVGQKMGMEMAAQESSLEIFTDHTQVFSGSETGSSVSHFFHEGKQMVQEPLWLQWRNKYALCWLDCILSMMVHLETLKMTCTEATPENISVIQNLFTKYNEATTLVNAYKRGESVSEVPLDVLSRAESLLNEIRNTVFIQLKPQLKCKLGEEESPVFAFPLFLQKDPQIEKLFLHSYLWMFECSQCGHQVHNRCQKTLTTFTKIIPEWHPLSAVHISPCNNCNHMTQRRKLVLENISPVLMMHFVEGLPHNDLKAYSFEFQEDSYQVTAVVQYQNANHFITWILKSNETWLEFDDLKGSYCRPHKNFGVPPSEIHIVVWERKLTRATNYLDLQQQNEEAKNRSVLKAQPDSPVVCVDNVKAVDNPALIFQSDSGLNSQTNDTENMVCRNKSNLLSSLESVTQSSVASCVNVLLGTAGDPLEGKQVLKDKVMGETGTLQVPQEINMPLISSEGKNCRNEHTLLENTAGPLHQGETNHTCDILTTPVATPGVPTSSTYIPVTLPVQSPSFDAAIPQNKIHQMVLENSTHKVHNIHKQAREIANSQVNTPAPTRDSPQAPHKKGTKSFVGSWVKGLLEKYPSFMPKSALTCSTTETSEKPLRKEANSLGRHASRFCGFQPKHPKKQTRKEINKAVGSSQKTLSPSASSTSSFFRIFGGTEIALIKSADSSVPASKPTQLKQNQGEHKNFTLAENASSSVDTAHQLRLTLLQQLKAKKERLALLDKLTKTCVRNRQSPKKRMNNQLKSGSKKEGECPQNTPDSQHYQSNTADSVSVISPSTTTSYCSTSSYDDILSELLSPATTVASLDLPQEQECRYLEIGGSCPESPVQNGAPAVGQDTSNGQTICNSLKESGCESHTDFLALKSSQKKLDFESPVKQDIWEDLLTSSVLNSVMDDAEVLHHFDESLLTW